MPSFSDLLYEDATGPADAQKGILVIMDIFGFFEQTLQGADILSSNGAEKYRVVVPDWFEGEPADISWYVLPPISSVWLLGGPTIPVY